MNGTDNGTLSLVRLAVGNDRKDNLDVNFYDADWNSLLTLSKKQGVSALVVDGLQNFLSFSNDCQPIAGKAVSIQPLFWRFEK